MILNPVKYNYNVVTMVFTGSEVDKELLYSGELVYYHTGSITLSVKLNSQSEDAIPISVKEQITAPFKALYLTPNAAGSVTLFLANPSEIKIDSRQVAVDTINNLLRDDSSKYYSEQQKAFTGGYSWQPAASNYGLIELFNPSGSGKKAVVSSLRPASVYQTNWIFALIVTSQLTSPTSVSKQNKYGGGTASVMNLQRKDDTTLPTTTGFFWSDSWYATGAAFVFNTIHPQVIQRDPIILPEGYGLRVVSTTVAQIMGAFFEWLEI